MDELLKKLLEAEVLTEETKKELESAFKQQISEAIEAAKKEAADSTTASLTEQWVTEKEMLVEAIDAKINEYLAEEMKELKSDIESFRDLQVEKEEDVAKIKAQMAEELKTDMAELVDQLDSFLEVRIASELDELKEDIKQVQELEFGREMYEAFTETYKKRFVDEDSVEAQLREAQEQIKTTNKKYEETVTAKRALERNVKMETILKSLSGKQREIMETLLAKLPTEQLEEGYKTFIGRVVKETVTEGKDDHKSEKEEAKVLAEAKSDLTTQVNEGKVVVKSGNNEQQLAEEKAVKEAEEKAEKPAATALTERFRILAGM